MRRVGAVLCLAVAARAAAADDEGADRAFVELTTPRASYFVHEPIPLRLRVAFDAAWFREHAVPLFRRAMDVPLHVTAPGLRRLGGAVPLTATATTSLASSVTFALDDDVVTGSRAGDVTRAGRSLRVVEVERRFVLTEPGDITVPAPRLQFAHATQFDDDVLQGRVPLDRRETVVDGAPLTIRVVALPVEGRPPGFTGAVGTFTVQSSVPAGDVAVGASFPLTLRVEGDGNLTSFDPPRLDGLDGFHVYGLLDDRGTPRRTITYDVAVLRDDVREVPPVAFAFFDPSPPGAYRTLHTQPIPLTVRTSQQTAGRAPPVEPAARMAPAVIVAIVAAILAGLAALVVLLRRRAAPSVTQVHPADAFRAEAARPDADLSAALTVYLAARLDCPASAVISADLPSRLMSAGVSAGLAARTAALVERLVGARYGGGPIPEAARAEASALVDDLDHVLAPASVSAPRPGP